MHLVIVNSCHPDTRHVCSLRARAFADALAAKGHRVVLLTPPLEETGKGSDAASLAARLESHDWSRPLAVVGGYKAGSILPDLRGGRCPAGIRQALIAWQFLRHGGVHEDWCAGTRPLLPALADTFRPDVVWAIFGNTGCWRIGQQFARRAGCAWVADLKDSWTNFIPSPFRTAVARRFTDATHLTALSATHAETIAPWLPKVPRTVVYSGIPPEFLTAHTHGPEDNRSERLILLTGGLYGLTKELGTLLDSLARWLEKETTRPAGGTVFTYAGADSDAVAAAARVLENHCRIVLPGFVALETLQALQRRAAINLYVRCPPFHHKVFELFAAGRPIVCYPAESAETVHLAAEVGARLYSCDTTAELESAFSRTLSEDTPAQCTVDYPALSRYGWEAQAEALESVLEGAIGRG